MLPSSIARGMHRPEIALEVGPTVTHPDDVIGLEGPAAERLEAHPAHVTAGSSSPQHSSSSRAVCGAVAFATAHGVRSTYARSSATT